MPATQTLITSTPTARRAAFAVLTALLLTAAVAGASSHGTGWWQLVRVRPRPRHRPALRHRHGPREGSAAPPGRALYNALHSYWGPALLAVASIALPAGYLDRRARVGVPHLARSRRRLRDAHARWLPALLTRSRRAHGRSSRPRARSSRPRARRPHDAPHRRAARHPRAVALQALPRQAGTRGGDHLGRVRGAGRAVRGAVAGSADPLADLAAAYRRFAPRPPAPLSPDDRPGAAPRPARTGRRGARRAARSTSLRARMPTARAPPGHSPTAWRCWSSRTASRRVPTSMPPGARGSARSPRAGEARSPRSPRVTWNAAVRDD